MSKRAFIFIFYWLSWFFVGIALSDLFAELINHTLTFYKALFYMGSIINWVLAAYLLLQCKKILEI